MEPNDEEVYDEAEYIPTRRKMQDEYDAWRNDSLANERR